MATLCPKCGSPEVSHELDAIHCLNPECNAYHQHDGTPRNPDPNTPRLDPSIPGAPGYAGHYDPPEDPVETPPEEVTEEPAAEPEPEPEEEPASA